MIRIVRSLGGGGVCTKAFDARLQIYFEYCFCVDVSMHEKSIENSTYFRTLCLKIKKCVPWSKNEDPKPEIFPTSKGSTPEGGKKLTNLSESTI